MGFVSPFDKYIEQMDFKFKDLNQKEIYYKHALNVNSDYFTQLVLSEIKYRADHQRNIIASIGGQQGCGKSIYGIQLARACAIYFGEPFDLQKHLFVDADLLNDEIRKTPYRTTHQYDEQPRKRVGYGSVSNTIDLSDYEEICRYTQKNIIYCSPSVLEHKHYFVFEQFQPEPDKLMNEDCLNCRIVSKCKVNKYETICEELTDEERKKMKKPKYVFNERDGYPTKFSFMLYTKRYIDDIFIPRGIVSFPMLPVELAKEYDEVKKNNIENFEKRQTQGWNNKIEELNKFIDEYEEHLIFENAKKQKKVRSKKAIKGIFFKKFGDRRYTIEQTEILIEMVKIELQERGYL